MISSYVQKCIHGRVLSSSALATLLCALPAIAQGMMEMGGVHATSSVIQAGGASGAHGLGNSLNRVYGGAAGSLSGGTVGGNIGANSTVQVPGGAMGLPPKVTAQNAGPQANKFLHDAQQADKAGKSDEALSNYRKSVAIRSAIWGYRDPAMGSIMTSMGNLYSKKNDLKNAELCYKQALMAGIHDHGQGDYSLCPPLGRLATNLYDQKRYEEAYNYEKQVVQLRTRKLGVQSTDTTASTLMLAKICNQAGSLGEASTLLSELLEVKQRLNDGTSKQLLDILETYSQVLKKKGDADAAAQIDAKAEQVRLASGAPAASSSSPGSPSVPVETAPGTNATPGTNAAPKEEAEKKVQDPPATTK